MKVYPMNEYSALKALLFITLKMECVNILHFKLVCMMYCILDHRRNNSKEKRVKKKTQNQLTKQFVTPKNI